MALKQDFIREKAKQSLADPPTGTLLWSRQATAELFNLHLSRLRVLEALQTAQVVEDFPPFHSPLADCLVLARLSSDRVVHMVLALDKANDQLVVVKLYQPSSEEWQNGWRKRTS